MQTNRVMPTGEPMNDETLGYFLTGLRVAIKQTGQTQTEFAEGVTTKENLSKILNKRVGTTAEMRQALADRAGLSIMEVVLLGKKESGNNVSDKRRKTDQLQKLDFVDLLRSAEAEYLRVSDSSRFWRSCFEFLHIAACIINPKGIVTHQNQADRSLFHMDMIGRDICEACKQNPIIPHPCGDECSVLKVKKIGGPFEHFIHVGETYCRVIASPFTINDEQHTVILTFEADELAATIKERDTLKEQIEFLLRDTKTAVIFSDQNQEVSYVSDAFLKLFGVARGEVKTSPNFWAILGAKVENPAEAIEACKVAHTEHRETYCKTQLSTGEKITMRITPASSKSGQMIGVLARITKEV